MHFQLCICPRSNVIFVFEWCKEWWKLLLTFRVGYRVVELSQLTVSSISSRRSLSWKYNGCFITLAPKKSNGASANNYRPISLLNCTLKLLTKLLFNRLQRVIIQLIHDNQCGFIKSWTIQDCLAWAYEYLHQCHKSKKELVILKLNFEKAFDKIDHGFILQVLLAKGFGTHWCHCIRDILSSATWFFLPL
jgi:hypothetical protein